MRALGLSSVAEWDAFCRGELPGKGALPDDIPKCPHQTYAGRGWAGYPDFLGTAKRPFAQARRFARSLGLRTAREWYAFCRGRLPEKGALPPDIPRTPEFAYRGDGWRGYPDWLGARTGARG